MPGQDKEKEPGFETRLASLGIEGKCFFFLSPFKMTIADPLAEAVRIWLGIISGFRYSSRNVPSEHVRIGRKPRAFVDRYDDILFLVIFLPFWYLNGPNITTKLFLNL